MGIHPTIEVSVLGMWDTMLLMVLALVVFGPRRLPKIGRQVGKLMYEFRKASNDFKFQMEEELRNAEEADRRKREEEERQLALAAAPPAQITAAATPGEAAAAAAVDGVLDTAAAPDSPSSYDVAAVEAEDEETGLRVHPPATGAPVPAEKPTSRAVELDDLQGGAQAGADEEIAAGEGARAEEIAAADESAVRSAAAEGNPAADEASGEASDASGHASSEVTSGDTEPAAYHG